MKIALAQLNTTVGDIAGNEARILAAYQRGAAAGVDLVVVPELALTGYPPRDLLLKSGFVARNLAALDRLAQATGTAGLIVGYVGLSEVRPGREFTNNVALLHEGRILATRVKTLLPTYDVFDEDRYFEPAQANRPVAFNGRSLGLTICEDVWNDEDFWQDRRYRRNPALDLVAAGAEIIVNASASPWSLGKHSVRRDMLASLAAKTGRPVVYCNLVGGNDELVFDGASLAFNARGEVIAQARLFEEDFVVFDLATAAPLSMDPIVEQASCLLSEAEPGDDAANRQDACSTTPGCSVLGGSRRESLRGILTPGNRCDEELVFKALALGLRDYVHKCGFKSALLGLSGGIDSALTAVIAVEALGRENVRGVSLPSEFSSQGSLDDARDLARNLGIQYDVVPIQPMFVAAKQQLAGVFAGRLEDTTEENIQARLRGVVLMAMSNKFGSLLLTTGNKSELAVGYCTLYGDMCGGLAVISDIPKTMVYRVARWVNRDRAVIPESSLTKAPSAELRPNQTDQDSLPPYEVLDAILDQYVVQNRSAAEIVQSGHDEATVRRVLRLIDLSEYKRRQAAPGLKVTSKAFGMGRRFPIAQRYREFEG